jgi:ADP-heptose:LPS heptosyltransferase
LKILIIRAGALGDTLMLMPAIAQLRARTEIVLAGRYPGIDYIRPYVAHCIDYEKSGWHRLFLEGAGRGHALSLPQADCVAAFLNDPEGRIERNLKASLSTASIHVFPAFPQEDEKGHMALYMARSLQKAGLPINARHALEASFKRPLLAGKQAASVRKGGIVLHPGSGSTRKNHPPEFWLELIKTLKMAWPDRSQEIILLMGPAEENLLPFFKDALDKRDAELMSCPEKEKLLSLLSHASLYIGHDSGITHIAAMLGTPVIALFKDSSIERWHPLGPSVRMLKGEKGRKDLLKKTLSFFTRI